MSSSIQCVITAAVENGLRVAAHEVCSAFAGKLAENGMLTCKHGEAMALLATLEITTKRSAAMKKVRAAQKSLDSGESKKAAIRKKPDMVLPFCGEIEESWCQAVRFNHGLHTQCTNGPANGGSYCKTCQKSADNSASGKPTYGTVQDRAAVGALEYRDPKGKLTTCYANVAKKMGLDLGRAQEVATAYGWTIPAEQLIETATKRGRPASKKAAKKSSKVAKVSLKKSNSMDDQIAQLVAEAAAEVLTGEPVEESKSDAPIKVKAKKPKKKAVDPAVEAAKLAKKQAAAELKAQKAAEKLAKKQAAAELKAQKEAEKLAKKQEREAKKQAAAELKAQKEAEKLAKKQEREAKKQAAAELKAQKEAEKLAKKQAAAEKKAKKQAAAEKKKVVAEVAEVDSSDGEETAEKVEETATIAESKTTELELEEEIIVPTTPASDEEEDEEGDELELNETMKVEISGVSYFKTPAFGLPAVLFAYPTGETVGAYDEASGEIQEIEFDD